MKTAKTPIMRTDPIVGTRDTDPGAPVLCLDCVPVSPLPVEVRASQTAPGETCPMCQGLLWA